MRNKEQEEIENYFSAIRLISQINGTAGGVKDKNKASRSNISK